VERVRFASDTADLSPDSRRCIAALGCTAHEEDLVAKGQKRSNREKKKPKQNKKKVATPASPIGSTDQRGKLGGSGGFKKA